MIDIKQYILNMRPHSKKVLLDNADVILDDPKAYKQDLIKKLKEAGTNLSPRCKRDTCNRLSCLLPTGYFCLKGGISNKLSTVDKMNVDKLARIDAMQLMIEARSNGS